MNTYNETRCEEDSRKAMEHINQQNAARKAAEADRNKAKAEERKKTRRKEMLRYIAACAVTVVAIAALFHCTDAKLIAPVLAVPATYIGTGYFGWCLHKVVAIFKKGAC